MVTASATLKGPNWFALTPAKSNPLASPTVAEDVDTRIHVTPDLLWDAGFKSLTRSQVSDLLAEIYDTLELRVGNRIAEQLDSNQLAQFERLIAGHDEQDALKWLQKSFPGYREVVKLEYQHIVNTLVNAASLRKSSSANEVLLDRLENLEENRG